MNLPQRGLAKLFMHFGPQSGSVQITEPMRGIQLFAQRCRQNTGWKPMLHWFSGLLRALSNHPGSYCREPPLPTRKRKVASASSLCSLSRAAVLWAAGTRLNTQPLKKTPHRSASKSVATLERRPQAVQNQRRFGSRASQAHHASSLVACRVKLRIPWTGIGPTRR